ncbi:MAG: uracil phosphoribosyltransferase [Burkholderiales bacterium]|nr:uracil phosphoribosyltransferase [Burkholderiales bacterium]
MNKDPRIPNLFIVNHPLVTHKLSTMREKETPSNSFRRLLRELTYLLGYEVTHDLPLETREIETPLCKCEAQFLAGKKLVIVPVLRAGLGMSDGLLDLMPSARVGHIGLYRGPDHRPVEYLVKLPKNLSNRKVIIADPMVATGYSAVAAIDTLVKHGVKPEDIVFLSLVAAPEGVEVFQKHYPQIPLYTAALDEKLDENAYILPGLGDAGDRIFGTK